MNKTEQGVRRQRKLTRLLIHILLFSISCTTPPVSAEISPATTPLTHYTQTSSKSYQMT